MIPLRPEPQMQDIGVVVSLPHSTEGKSAMLWLKTRARFTEVEPEICSSVRLGDTVIVTLNEELRPIQCVKAQSQLRTNVHKDFVEVIEQCIFKLNGDVFCPQLNTKIAFIRKQPAKTHFLQPGFSATLPLTCDINAKIWEYSYFCTTKRVTDIAPISASLPTYESLAINTPGWQDNASRTVKPLHIIGDLPPMLPYADADTRGASAAANIVPQDSTPVKEESALLLTKPDSPSALASIWLVSGKPFRISHTFYKNHSLGDWLTVGFNLLNEIVSCKPASREAGLPAVTIKKEIVVIRARVDPQGQRFFCPALNCFIGNDSATVEHDVFDGKSGIAPLQFDVQRGVWCVWSFCKPTDITPVTSESAATSQRSESTHGVLVSQRRMPQAWSLAPSLFGSASSLARTIPVRHSAPLFDFPEDFNAWAANTLVALCSHPKIRAKAQQTSPEFFGEVILNAFRENICDNDDVELDSAMLSESDFPRKKFENAILIENEEGAPAHVWLTRSGRQMLIEHDLVDDFKPGTWLKVELINNRINACTEFIHDDLPTTEFNKQRVVLKKCLIQRKCTEQSDMFCPILNAPVQHGRELAPPENNDALAPLEYDVRKEQWRVDACCNQCDIEYIPHVIQPNVLASTKTPILGQLSPVSTSDDEPYKFENWTEEKFAQALHTFSQCPITGNYILRLFPELLAQMMLFSAQVRWKYELNQRRHRTL